MEKELKMNALTELSSVELSSVYGGDKFMRNLGNGIGALGGYLMRLYDATAGYLSSAGAYVGSVMDGCVEYATGNCMDTNCD